MTRVLLTYAGGSYGLGVSRSLKVASVPYHVIATDADRFSIQRAEGDERHRVPRASQQSFPAINRRAGALTPAPTSSGRAMTLTFCGSPKTVNSLGAATFLPPVEDIVICRNKLLSYLRWRERGVRVPETTLVSNREGLIEAFDHFGGEVWIRAVSGAGGTGALGTDSLRKAEAWLEIHDGWGQVHSCASYQRRSAAELGVGVGARRADRSAGSPAACPGFRVPDDVADYRSAGREPVGHAAGGRRDRNCRSARDLRILPHGNYGVDMVCRRRWHAFCHGDQHRPLQQRRSHPLAGREA